MREIKFRTWHKENKKMYDLYLISFTNGQCGLDNFGMELRERLIIMQFTGLKDKNGKEIWEGDIVRFKYKSQVAGLSKEFDCVVEWDSCNPCFKLREINGERTEYDFIMCGLVTLEIIGTIHENPELLNG